MRRLIPAAAVALVVAIAACGGDGEPEGAPAARVIDQFRVEGAGMSATLEDGMTVDVLAYEGRAPARGDVVVFLSPAAAHRLFVKRIIALPGDRIEIDAAAGSVKVNGQPLDEPYARGRTDCTATCAWTLPAAGSPESEAACGSSACYFVLGDNRRNSSDSRQGWLVPAENIAGWVDAGD